MTDPERTFRRAAERRGFLFGAALNAKALATDPEYGPVAGREFNILTPENEMKFYGVVRKEGAYEFTAADALVAFGQKHGMAIHGHTLVWHDCQTAWVQQLGSTPAGVRTLLDAHIRTVAGRYRGQILIWDVANEVIDDATLSWRASPWLASGPDYVDFAFRVAHETDPVARLYYNDFRVENLTAKSDAMYKLVAGMQEHGVPIHGVGIQTHVRPGELKWDEFARNLRRFGALGLELLVSELDVRLKTPASAADLKTQAEEYRRVLEICLAEPAMRGVQMWGFTDRHSWVPGFIKGEGEALPFDAEYRPKPAYQAILEQLN